MFMLKKVALKITGIAKAWIKIFQAGQTVFKGLAPTDFAV